MSDTTSQSIATEDATEADPFPRTVPYALLPGLLAGVRVSLGPTSPLPLGDGSAPIAATADVEPRLAEGLRIAAAPERVLRLTRVDDDGPVEALFLQRAGHLVRIHLREEAFVISAPSDARGFALDVCGFLDVPEHSDAGDFVITRRMMIALACLHRRAAGAPLPYDHAVAALGPAIVDGVDAKDLLGVLADAGALATIDGGFVIAPTWARTHGHLFSYRRAEVQAVEVPDLGRRIVPLRMLILGHGAQASVTLLPAETRRLLDRRILLAPATRREVEAVLLALASGPITPPELPAPSRHGSRVARAADRGAPGEDRAVWRAATTDQIKLLEDQLGAGIPAALLHPERTLVARRLDVNGPTHVIAIGAEGAVEWTMDGALVVWRDINLDEVNRVVEAVVPAGVRPPPAGEPPAARVDPTALAALQDRPGSAVTDAEVPPALAAVGDDVTVRWFTLRALARTPTGIEGVGLTLAVGELCGCWTFDADGDVVLASRADPLQLRASVVRALGI